ncbi:serine hydrolase [Planomonospora parontospora subsp. parontospora]|uniref:Serine hydrolase n=2 Tax=Planomonospora parontospora TaxID=58119 RepID=A0AA37BEZ1_9ACTN|nr:serine hydrolase [Planomonospora parontospora]GII12314.1 serine hydrolase [Planomonospora parontospora subsp. parontospora]
MRMWKAAAIACLAGALLGTGATAANALPDAAETAGVAEATETTETTEIDKTAEVTEAAEVAKTAGPSATTGLSATAIDRYVRGYLERTRLPGALVAVTKDGQVVHAAGYGRTATGEAITADTPMPLASLSKSFTALAVLRLADQGRIGLDDPVRKHLPEFTMADPRAGRITVRELLQQTSGMSDRTFPELTLPAPDTLKDAVAMLRDAPLAAEPGTRMIYHNPNYAVAARLAEVVAGVPFADHLAAAVFRPLGMTSTTTVDVTTDLPHAGEGHVRAYGQVVRRSHPKWFVNGSYGVVSTARDMARWLIAQNGAGGAFPEETLRTAQRASGVGGSHYGMGWETGKTAGGAPALRHTGWLLTHNSAQTLLPESGYGIAVVTNTGMISGDDAVILTDGLIDLLEGRTDAGAVPFTTTADPWLGGLTLLSLGAGLAGVCRARRWARRRSGQAAWRPAVRLVPWALPIVFFLGLADLVGFLMRRVGTLDQISYVWPALYVWAGAGALASAAVIVSRLVHLVLARRPAAPTGGRSSAEGAFPMPEPARRRPEPAPESAGEGELRAVADLVGDRRQRRVGLAK